jgi:hypothetical protein
MSRLLVHAELTKLAHDLRVEVAELEALAVLSRDELVELRSMVSQALFAPHEHRFTRFAAMARLVPAGLAAKIAELALGPFLTARVAAVTEPELAVRMAGHISPEFMARMSPYLDPTKIAGILAGLPEETVVDVGRRLVTADEPIALGRFMSLVPVAVSVQVVEEAPPLQLLQIALLTDDPAALDAVICELPDERIVGVLEAATQADAVDDAVAMQAPLPSATRTRILRLASRLDVAVRDALVLSVSRNDAWGQLVDVLDDLGADDARSLLDVPAMQDAEVRAGLTASAAGNAAAEAVLGELAGLEG